MKKNYLLIISIFPIFLPILIALMYAAGLNYYSAYLRAFGIPYGIFNIGVNEVLFFGGEVLTIFSYNFIEYAAFIVIFICFSVIFFQRIIDKLDLSRYFQFEARNNDSFSCIEIYLISFCCCILFIIALMFLFVKVIQFSLNYGEEMGGKQKHEFNKNLLMIKNNNNKVKGTDTFLFKMNNHRADKIGYIIASKEEIIALYTVNGLVFERVSNIDEVQKYNFLRFIR